MKVTLKAIAENMVKHVKIGDDEYFVVEQKLGHPPLIPGVHMEPGGRVIVHLDSCDGGKPVAWDVEGELSDAELRDVIDGVNTLKLRMEAPTSNFLEEDTEVTTGNPVKDKGAYCTVSTARPDGKFDERYFDWEDRLVELAEDHNFATKLPNAIGEHAYEECVDMVVNIETRLNIMNSKYELREDVAEDDFYFQQMMYGSYMDLDIDPTDSMMSDLVELIEVMSTYSHHTIDPDTLLPHESVIRGAEFFAEDHFPPAQYPNMADEVEEERATLTDLEDVYIVDVMEAHNSEYIMKCKTAKAIRQQPFDVSNNSSMHQPMVDYKWQWLHPIDHGQQGKSDKVPTLNQIMVMMAYEEVNRVKEEEFEIVG